MKMMTSGVKILIGIVVILFLGFLIIKTNNFGIMQESAGLLIIKNGKILLCHPTNAAWFETYSIPKGLIEDKDEDKIDAAIRETYEEIGVEIPRKMIDTTEHVIEYKDKNGFIFKTVTYFVVDLNGYSNQEFTIPDTLEKELQWEEVDWAGFVTYKEAKKRIFWRFKPLLEHIK